MKHHLHTVAALALCGLLTGPSADAQTVTPAQWLTNQPKPAFKAGHTLPRLTRYGWSMPLDVRVKLCEDWGYALEFGRAIGLGAPIYDGVTYDTAWRLNDPNSGESQMAALAKADPARYPLSVEITKRVPNEAEAPAGSYARNASGQTLYSGVQQQPDGTSIPAGPVWSLEAPQATWDLFSEYRVSGLRELQSRDIPVFYILNGGEYGIEFWYNDHTYWEQDPRYNTAVAQSPYGQGLFLEYCSAAEANTEHIIANAVKTQVPQRALYVPYTAGGRTERNRYYAINEYGGFWEHTRGQGDLPSKESYYRSNGDGFVTTSSDGRRNMLTQALNAKALEIQTGNPLSYDWISAGWDRGDPSVYVADMNRWAGLLKCFYTAGMIGCNVGDYEGPGSLPGGYTETNGSNAGYEASFSSASPPNFLKHQVASSHIHALFSQVESIVRNSDLLPGPAQHEMSRDVPAHEFPTGEGENSRVLARKHRTNATWLITAWAAAGNDRNVSVYIPELGQITLQARIVGSVYTATLANGNVTLTRIDNEGATYTSVANGTPVTTSVNLAIPSPLATNRLLWLSADSEVTADGAGKVSSWGSLGNSVSVDQTDASKRPTLVANAINGKPALRFENTQTWMQGNITGSGFDEYLTAFVVFTPAGTTNKTLISAGNGSQFFSMNDDAINYESVTSNGITRKVYPRDFLAAPLTAFMVGDTIQYGAGNSNGLSGDISEILVYKNISPQSGALVKEYLDDKYNLNVAGTLANGSFESPVVTGYRYTPNTGGWYFANTSAIQANGSAWGASNAPNGSQTAVIQGNGKQLGSMSQTVKLAEGNYTLSFKAARRGGTIQPLRVMIDGTQIGSLVTPAGDGFEDITLNFVTSAGKHTIRFEATDGSGDKSTFIDQVVLNKIATAAAQSFSNGSFETPAVNGYQYSPTGSGWNFTGLSVIQANGGGFSSGIAPDGIQTAVVQGQAPYALGSISQTINLPAGNYTVSFKAARRFNEIQPVKFSVNGTQVDLNFTPASNAFQSFTTSLFTVTAGNQIFRFEATTGVGDNSTLIDDVQLNTALGSLNASIGTVNPVGSGTLSGAGVYTITGSGLGITGTADKGHLYYDKLTGNGSIVAKVLSVQNTNASAKAGIMIRETTATGSKNVFLAFTPNGTVNFQRRTALNGTTTNTTAVAAIPSWIKLTRVGNTFQAYRSTNGTTWVAVGAALTNAMTSDVFIGLGVSSNTSTTACTATFSNVTLTGAITRL